MFNHSPQELSDLCAFALSTAKQKGATAAEADLSESVGQSVQVRLQEIEQIEHQQDKSLDITVYLGQSKGRASTADLSSRAIEETVQAALDIARYTAGDDCAGLADAELMAAEFGDLDKYHEWDLPSADAVELSLRCEAAAMQADSRIKNSEGAGIQTSHYQFVYGNSHGFLQHQQGTRHSVSCAVVAEDGNGGMQRDYWYDLARSADELDSMEAVGRTAAERTVRRLNARSLPTGSYPVLFDTTVSAGLIGHVVGGLSGGSLYRQSSFLLDSLGKQILPEFLSLREEPHIPRAWSSTYFDSEGVATRPRAQSDSERQLQQPGRTAAPNGDGAAGYRTDGTGREHAHRRLFARRGRILGGKRRDPISGGRNHRGRTFAGYAARHRRRG